MDNNMKVVSKLLQELVQTLNENAKKSGFRVQFSELTEDETVILNCLEVESKNEKLTAILTWDIQNWNEGLEQMKIWWAMTRVDIHGEVEDSVNKLDEGIDVIKKFIEHSLLM